MALLEHPPVVAAPAAPGAASVEDMFRGTRVLVIGDVTVQGRGDAEASGRSNAGPPEAVTVGCAGGVAKCLVGLGAGVCLVGLVGDDAAGMLAREVLEAAHVECDGLFVAPGTRTPAARAASPRPDGQQRGLVAKSLRAAAVSVADRWSYVDAVVFSDDRHGSVSENVIEAARRLGSDHAMVIVGSGEGAPRLRSLRPTAVSQTLRQALAASGLASLPRGTRARSTMGVAMLSRTGARLVAVTVPNGGAILFEPGRPIGATLQPAGSLGAEADETFTAALTLALSSGLDAAAACGLATRTSARLHRLVSPAG